MTRDFPGSRCLLVSALAAMTALVACNGTPTAPAEQTLEGPAVTLLRTDSASYTLLAADGVVRGTIQARLVNHTNRNIYIGNCQGSTSISLEKWIDGRWEIVWSPVRLACASEPIVVPAGATWDANVSIFAGYEGGRLQPQFELGDIPGTYRVVWYELSGTKLAYPKQLPLDQRISNPFTLHVDLR